MVKGDQWNAKDWNWLKMSVQIVNDGLIDLILACHIEINPINSTEHILVVCLFHLQIVHLEAKLLNGLVC